MAQIHPHRRHTIVLLAALHTELAATIDRLDLRDDGTVCVGQIGQAQIVAAVTGIGASRAIATTNRLLDRVVPDQVILLGFAGGLDPKLRPATLLPITWVLNEHGSVLHLDSAAQATPSDNDPPPAPQHVDKDQPRHTERSLVTLDRLAHTVAAKRELFIRHRCAAVDMETYHVASLLARHGVPLTVLRAIHDSADMALPAATIDWVKPNGRADAMAAARYLVTHPWQVKTLIWLGMTTQRAARRLAESAQTLIQMYGR